MVKILKYLSSRRSVALLSADMLLLFITTSVLLLFITTSVLQDYVIHLNTVVAGHTVSRLAVPFVVTIIATLAVATMGFCQWDFCWDHRSWILRLIVACSLVVVMLAGSLLYPDSVPTWADGYVQSMGFYIAAVAAFIVGIHALRFGPRLRTRRICSSEMECEQATLRSWHESLTRLFLSSAVFEAGYRPKVKLMM